MVWLRAASSMALQHNGRGYDRIAHDGESGGAKSDGGAVNGGRNGSDGARGHGANAPRIPLGPHSIRCQIGDECDGYGCCFCGGGGGEGRAK